MKKLLLMLAMMATSLSGFSHGVQAGYCILPNGFIRVYIEHWHGDQTIATLHGNGMSISTTVGTVTTTQNVNPSGAVNNTMLNSLLPGTTVNVLYACAGAANTYNDWAFYDFAPGSCNVPVSITLNAGLTVVLDEACGDLWPRTIPLQTFTDNAAPILSCPNPTATVSCGEAGTNVAFSVGKVDACDPNPTLTLSHASGSFFPVGTTWVTATATDASNFSSTCTFPVVVSVVDNVPPTIAGIPANISLPTGPGSTGCGRIVEWTPPTATDNCNGPVTVSSSHQPGALFPVGTTAVTYTFTDGNNNSSSCSFNVSIQDNTAPVAVAKNASVILGSDGLATLTAALINNGSTDNCGIATTSFSPANLSCSNVAGVSTAGNAMQFTGGYIDVPNDASLNPLNTWTLETWVKLSATGQQHSLIEKYDGGSMYGYLLRITAGNKLMGGVVTAGSSSGGTYVTGTTSLAVNTWYHVAATYNRTGQVKVYVNGVLDGSAVVSGSIPTNPATASLKLGARGNDGLTRLSGWMDETRIWSTERSETEISANKNKSFSGSETGLQGYYRFEDAAAGTTVTDITPLTARNTGDEVGTVTPGASSAPVNGATPVTLTVTDVHGNTSSAVSFVTVVDNINPTITAPAAVSVGTDLGSCTASGVALGTPIVADNCPGTTVSNNAPATFPIGTTTVTWTVTDASNNIATASQLVTVADNQAPVIAGAPTSGSIPPAVLANVPEAAQYRLVYSLDIANSADYATAAQIPYSVNNASALANASFNRVAYYMQLDNKWVWVSMNKFTSDVSKLGLPTGTTAWQQTVNGMNIVASANSGLTNATNVSTGNIEFWDNCYGTGNTAGISGANGSNYDFGDSRELNSPNCYGSFQVHNYGVAKTLFAYNHWAGGSNSDLGIGNNPSGHPDWTFMANAQTYGAKKLFVFIDNAPTALAPITATANPGQCGATIAVSTPTASDNCGTATVTGTRSDNLSLGSNYPTGSTTITWTATDGNLASSTTQLVTVTDNELPVITAASNITATTDAGSCSATVSVGTPNATDNCSVGIPSGTRSDAMALNAPYPVGSTNVVWTVTDAAGNAAAPVVQTVTVSDNQAPVITTNGDQAVMTDAGMCGAFVSVSAFATDNCSVGLPVGSRSDGYVLGAPYPVGTTIITWNVTDMHGVSALPLLQTVTVTDNQFPTVSTQSAVLILDASGSAVLTVAQVDNGSFDNCAISSIALSKTTFDCTNTGNNTVNLTVTDVNGNVSSLSAFVTVMDTTAPAMTAHSITVQLDATGNVSITPADVLSNLSDACGIESTVLSVASFDCSDTGPNSVTVMATDVNGNVGSATAIVNVEDNIAPLAVTKNYTAQLDASGNATITAADVDNGSSDVCGIASMTVLPSSFTCLNVGLNTVILTVTDNNGNVSTETATVTVVDNVAPVAVAQNITRQLDASGNLSITAGEVNNNSSDACGIASVTVSPSSFSCANVGANNVTLTVTDNNGNVSTALATVTVEDNTAPVVVTQPRTIYLNANGSASISATDMNNGSTDACGILPTDYQLSKTAFDCSNVGTNTVTLTVTDKNGNVASKPEVVTVIDDIAPTVLTKPISVTLNAAGNATISAADVNDGSFDNCSIASMSLDKTGFNCNNLGPNPVMLTVTDVNGKSTVAPAVVTVIGEIPAGNITVAQPANAPFTGGVATSIYLGYGAQVATLTANSTTASPIVSWAWSGPALNSANTQSTVFTPQTGGMYAHAVEITNAYGCKTTLTTPVDFCVKNVQAPSNGSNQKVYICHNGNTLSVSANAIPSHMAHSGDYLGMCAQTCGSNMAKMSDGENGIIGELIIDQDLEMTVYPNPTSTEFRVLIESISTDVADLIVYDLAGRVVERAAASRTNTEITLGRNLAPGVYFVEVRHGDLSKKIKVVKL